MTGFLHVVVKLSGEPKPRCLFSDLSSSDLRSKFVRPYRSGQSIMVGNRVVSLSQVTEVRIIQTAANMATSLKEVQRESLNRIERFNREVHGAFLISAGSGWEDEDIVETGEDVTANYVQGPPGHGLSGWAGTAIAFAKDQWVVTIGGGLMLLLIAAALGLG